MESHSITTSPFACCPNLSGGTPEFMESMTFWLDFLSVVAVGTTILVALVSIAVGVAALVGITSVKKAAGLIAAETATSVAEKMINEKFAGMKSEEFQPSPMSGQSKKTKEQ